jgi:hypothetical protein
LKIGVKKRVHFLAFGGSYLLFRHRGAIQRQVRNLLVDLAEEFASTRGIFGPGIAIGEVAGVKRVIAPVFQGDFRYAASTFLTLRAN